MKAGLFPVTKDNFPFCVDFLASREYRCISLMSHLVADGKPAFPAGLARDFVCLSESGNKTDIDGVLYGTRTGILFHCFREERELEIYAPALRAFLSQATIRCIIGERDGTLFLESLIPASPDPAVDYQLMILETLPSEKQCMVPESAAFEGESARITVLNPWDAENLYRLQEEYELEEVVPPGGPFSREACHENLLLALERQYIFGVKRGNSFIAKAGTNALGLNWDQMGGVYTLPQWRGRGIASALVAHTARERMLAGRKIALFVKLSNLFAQKSYKNAGFLPKNLFRLSYYNYN